MDQHPFHHGGNGTPHVDLLLLDQPQDLAAVEPAGEEHELGAGQQRQQQQLERADVEQRQAGERHAHRLVVGDLVREGAASRPTSSGCWPRSTRCDSVAPFGNPVVPEVNRMTAGRSSSSSTETSAVVSGACASSSTKTTVDASGRRSARRSSETTTARRGELDDVGHLRLGPPAVAQHDDGAELEDGEEGDRPLRAVAGEDRHPVALAAHRATPAGPLRASTAAS